METRHSGSGAAAPFVVGVPRSGTTLLRLMLDAHPDLAIPPETHFWFPLLAESRAGTQNAERVGRIITSHFTWCDFDLDAEAFRTAIGALPGAELSDALRLFYRAYAQRHGKTRWGEKTPDYGSILDRIEAVLPEARFIHIIRDGRDVAASARNLWFGAGPSIIEQARQWTAKVEATRRLGASCRFYCELRYEELVAAPEKCLRRLSAFLDLSYSDAMLQFHNSAEARLAELKGWPEHGVTREQFRWLHARTSLPADEKSVGRWRNDLTSDEVRSFEEIADQTLETCGYARNTARASSRVAGPELSAVLLTDKLTPETAGWFARVRDLADELVVLVDVTRADDETHRHARAIATRVIEVTGQGYLEAHLEEMVDACRGEWILRLDSDERLSCDWSRAALRELLRSRAHTHFITPSRWMHPAGGFLCASPWWPDRHIRLFRNDRKGLQFPTLIHEPMSVAGGGGYLPDMVIEHHVLRLKTRAEREAKVQRYERLRPGFALGHYYLFEDFNVPVAPLPPSMNGKAARIDAPMPVLDANDCLAVQIWCERLPERVVAGAMFLISVSIRNAASHALSSVPPHPVHIAYHWVSADGETITFDGLRSEISPALLPNSREAKFLATILAPETPGAYLLRVTLVQEEVRWFEEVNPSIASEHSIEVIARKPAAISARGG